jgi:hypothetical protein
MADDVIFFIDRKTGELEFDYFKSCDHLIPGSVLKRYPVIGDFERIDVAASVLHSKISERYPEPRKAPREELLKEFPENLG